MKALFSFASVLIVLAIVAVTVRTELRATQAAVAPAPASAASDAQGASAPFGGSSSPTLAQFRQELDKTMQTAADRAASAGGAADVR